jgi:hypothetical protein
MQLWLNNLFTSLFSDGESLLVRIKPGDYVIVVE